MASNKNKPNIAKSNEETKSVLEDSDKIKSVTDNCNKVDEVAGISTAAVAPEQALKNVLLYAKQNHLKYKRNNTYCKVCDVKISSSFARLQEHVEEQKHKDNASKIVKAGDSKVPVSDFITTKVGIQTLLFDEIVINDAICISCESFQTFTQYGANFKCQICEVSVKPTEKGAHIEMWQHVKGMQTTSVLMTFDTEFVREVRPEVYHCGFCNFVEGGMKGLKNHLKSTDHIKRKFMARNRLYSHLPDISEYRRRKTFERLVQEHMRNLFL